jgi:chaperone modulatory protein CbpM
MPTATLISAHEFLAYHQLDVSFVITLEEQGVLETTTIGPVPYLHPDQLGPIERLIRLHRELAVHVDDLDIVAHLLERLERVQEQVSELQNRLAFYEPMSRLQRNICKAQNNTKSTAKLSYIWELSRNFTTTYIASDFSSSTLFKPMN